MTQIYIDVGGNSEFDLIKQRRREIENSEELTDDEKLEALLDLMEDEYECYADLTEEQREEYAYAAECEQYEWFAARGI